MLRTFLLLTLTICLGASVAAQSATEEVLPAGMLLQCTLDEPNFSSRTAEIGDPVLCHVGALPVFGRLVFPRGADLAAPLTMSGLLGHEDIECANLCPLRGR